MSISFCISWIWIATSIGLPRGLSWSRIRLHCKRTGFDSWVGKIPCRRNRLHTWVFLGFPGGLAGKESYCNEGDLGSIPGLERSAGEGNSYPLQYSGLENSLYSPWGHKELDTTEQLSFSSISLFMLYLNRNEVLLLFLLMSLFN